MRSAGFEYSRTQAERVEPLSEPQQITAHRLLSELRAIAMKHDGIVFLYDDYRKLGGTRARGTFCKYLGGWRQAVASIGLKDGFSRTRPDLRTYADEDYFVELQRLWESLGRQPAAREMRQGGRISPQSFQQRFGSWMKAVYAFCEDRNGPEYYDNTDPDPQLEQNEQRRRLESYETIENPQLRPNSHTAKRRTPRKPSFRLRFQVLQRDNFTCRTCGRSPATEIGVILEVDHVFAWSRGGETLLANLQTLCDRCNSGKSNL